LKANKTALNNYSFIRNPAEGLHELVIQILPGIEKIISVHGDDSGKSSGLLSERENKSYNTRRLDLTKIEPLLTRFRNEQNPFDWYSRQNLPFEIDKKTGQPTIDIFSELQNVVLLIRLPEPGIQKNILLFIYLNENPSNFGISNSINPLTTDNKSIIAYLLRNSLITFMENERRNKKTLLESNARTRQIIDQAREQKKESIRIQDSYGLSLVELCQQYLSEYSKKTGRQIYFSPEAIEKIKGYKGELKTLEEIIEKTVSFAVSLNFELSGDIEISDWHLQFNLAEKQPPAGPAVTAATTSEDRYGKTILLLDKLESAALKVKTQQLKMTGTNVGRACPVPISAPAITDALQNHQKKINTLIQRNPEKWQTIRGEFKPVINILRDENRKD
jgi:hypothetical protein